MQRARRTVCFGVASGQSAIGSGTIESGEGDQGSKMADDRNWRIDHTGIGVSDIHRSARFYETALRSLGVKIVMRVTRGFEPITDESTDLGGVEYGTDYPVFWIDVFHPHSVKQHVAFRAQRRQQVASTRAEVAAAVAMKQSPRPSIGTAADQPDALLKGPRHCMSRRPSRSRPSRLPAQCSPASACGSGACC